MLYLYGNHHESLTQTFFSGHKAVPMPRIGHNTENRAFGMMLIIPKARFCLSVFSVWFGALEAPDIDV